MEEQEEKEHLLSTHLEPRLVDQVMVYIHFKSKSWGQFSPGCNFLCALSTLHTIYYRK
jgi:hypothetical protein